MAAHNGVEIEAFIDGAWVSLPSDFDSTNDQSRVRNDPGVTITRGKAPNASRAEATECAFTLANKDGKYSSKNPRSPYWGKLLLNTPCRVIAKDYETYLDIPVRDTSIVCSAPDAAALDITGDIEIRIECEIYNNDIVSYTLCGKYHTTGDQRSWMLRLESGFPRFYWSPDGTNASRRSLTCNAPMPTGRRSLRVQFDVNNGAGGVTATFSTAETIDGTYTTLGTPVSSATTSSIYASNTALELASTNGGGTGITNSRHLIGKLWAFRMYNGIGGTVVVDSDFTNLEMTDTSYDDGTTVMTWAAPAHVASDRVRFYGQIPSWPIEWDSTATNVLTTIKAQGLIQQMNEGGTALRSPMFNYYTTLDTIIGYWPGTDGTEATIIGAASQNTNDAKPVLINFSAQGDLPGSEPLFTIDEGSSATGAFPNYSDPGSFATTFAFYVDAFPAVDVELIRFSTTTGYHVFGLGTNAYSMQFYSSDGTNLSGSSSLPGAGAEPGQWIIVVFEMAQNGGNVDWVVNWRTLDPIIGYAQSGSYAGTLGKLKSWTISGLVAGHNLDVCSLGQIAATRGIDDLLEQPHITSFRGYVFETAAERITRICEANGIDIIIRGIESESAEMGPQPLDTVLGILDDAAKTDRGILVETRYKEGLTYWTRRELERYAPVIVAYDDSIITATPKVTEETPNLANDVTVSRQNGGSSRRVTTTGTRAVSIRQYATDPTLNVAADEQTGDLANWIRHIGSWDELRFTNIPFDMSRAAVQADPVLMKQLIGLDIGYTLSITDLPTFLPARPSIQLIEQYEEFLNRLLWSFDFETSPARPYNTAHELDNRLFIGTSSSQLSTAINDSTTTVIVKTDAVFGGWKYTEDFDIEIDGRERCTVTAVSGTSTPFTLTVVRGVDGVAVAHAVDVPIQLYDERVISGLGRL